MTNDFQVHPVIVDDHEAVRECPWTHAEYGDCTKLVAQYQMSGPDLGDGAPTRLGARCTDCGKWIAPRGIEATHNRVGYPYVPAGGQRCEVVLAGMLRNDETVTATWRLDRSVSGVHGYFVDEKTSSRINLLRNVERWWPVENEEKGG